MLFYFSSQKYTYLLGDACQNQIGMEGFSSGKAKAVFEVIDGALYCGSDLIRVIPFVSSSHGTGISTQVFFRVKVDSSSHMVKMYREYHSDRHDDIFKWKHPFPI